MAAEHVTEIRKVRVEHREEDVGWRASSPDIDDWFVTGRADFAARRAVEPGVRCRLHLTGVEIDHEIQSRSQGHELGARHASL